MEEVYHGGIYIEHHSVYTKLKTKLENTLYGDVFTYIKITTQ